MRSPSSDFIKGRPRGDVQMLKYVCMAQDEVGSGIPNVFTAIERQLA